MKSLERGDDKTVHPRGRCRHFYMMPKMCCWGRGALMFSTKLHSKSSRAYGKNRAEADHLKPVAFCNQSTTKITVLLKYKPS